MGRRHHWFRQGSAFSDVFIRTRVRNRGCCVPDNSNVFIRFHQTILANVAYQQVFLPERAIFLAEHLHGKFVEDRFRNMISKVSVHDNNLLGKPITT